MKSATVTADEAAPSKTHGQQHSADQPTSKPSLRNHQFPAQRRPKHCANGEESRSFAVQSQPEQSNWQRQPESEIHTGATLLATGLEPKAQKPRQTVLLHSLAETQAIAVNAGSCDCDQLAGEPTLTAIAATLATLIRLHLDAQHNGIAPQHSTSTRRATTPEKQVDRALRQPLNHGPTHRDLRHPPKTGNRTQPSGQTIHTARSLVQNSASRSIKRCL